MDEESKRILREGAEALRQIRAAQSAAMRAAEDTRIAAADRVKTAMLELVEALMEEEAQILREGGRHSEEEIAAHARRVDNCGGRSETISEIADESYDLPDAAWWALSYAWDAIALIQRVPVTPEALAFNKRREDT
jgi:hypothetical protein